MNTNKHECFAGKKETDFSREGFFEPRMARITRIASEENFLWGEGKFFLRSHSCLFVSSYSPRFQSNCSLSPYIPRIPYIRVIRG